jgi:hypothetical protein
MTDGNQGGAAPERGGRGIGKIIRAAVTVAMILFIPLMRSCGRISAGFPFVAISQGSGPGLSFQWINLGLNLAVGLVAVLAVFFLMKAVKRPQTRQTLESGFSFLEIYVALVVIGYLIVLPLLVNSKDGTIAATFFMAYAFFIHPFFGIVTPMQSLFPESLASSSLFGDDYDLPMRLGFALMCLAWFALGCAKSAVSARSSARRHKGI